MTAVPPNQAEPALTVPSTAAPGQPGAGPTAPSRTAPSQTAPSQAATARSIPAPTTSPADAPAAKRAGRRRFVPVAGVVVALAAAGGGWAWASAGDVPRGTRVLGVDLGTLSRSRAEATLAQRFADRVTAPVKVTVTGRTVEVKPDDIGLALDVGGTVAAAAKGTPRLWGTRTVAPVIALDAAKLDAVLRKAVDPGQITRTSPAVTYEGLTPKPTYPKGGRDLDPARSADLVRAGWLVRDTIDVPLVERAPALTNEQVDAVIKQVGVPAVAAPVTVTTERGPFTVTPEMLAASVVFDRNTMIVDPAKLGKAIAKALTAVEVPPEEAKISLDGDAPKVVASSPGRSVDLAKLATDLSAVLRDPAPRQVGANLVTSPAKTTDQDMLALGIKEKVSTFTTKFTGGLSSPRSQNIVTISKEVDGAVVKPGETFSLNGHTGERTYRDGYQDAPVIVDGKLSPGVGGGASQFTTTLFNAAYYAGMQDVEHKPHSFYFSRYPEVIEATIFWPSLDLKFKNTTPYGVLIDTSYTEDSITVTMWSTTYYDSVTSEKGDRRYVTSPPTIHRTGEGDRCIATDGLPGFSMDVWRVIHKDGAEVKRERFSWKYDPEPRFVCD